MRVLHVLRQSYGGTLTHVNNLQSVLLELGHESDKFGNESVIPRIPDYWGDKKLLKALKDKAKEFDVIHAHGYRPAWLCSGIKDTPWVFTAHSPLKKKNYDLIKRLNKADAGFAVSVFIASQLESWGIQHLVINPGGLLLPFGEVLQKDEAKRRFRFDPAQPVISALGRLVPEKGFHVLVKSLERVWDVLPQTCLLLSGTGPQREELRGLAMKASKPENIRYVEKWPKAEQIYCAGDLFVMPSVSEGLGLASIEAMSLGVPVLARDVEGLGTVFEDGVSGVYFKSDEELPLKICELLQAPTLLRTIGNAGRLRVEERFDFRKNVHAIIEVYEKVIKRRSKK